MSSSNHFGRFLGRLSVGRKLALIYLLDLTAVIYVSSILINEKFIGIDFARKELAGNTYIVGVREALVGPPLFSLNCPTDHCALKDCVWRCNRSSAAGRKSPCFSSIWTTSRTSMIPSVTM